jgi:acetate---CoA ligase (ADP-forming)
VAAAIIVLPAEAAVEAVADCARRGIGAVVVGASGFAEAGPAGRELEERLREIAEERSMAVVGPNSNGVASLRSGQALAFQPILQAPGLPVGTVSVVSQSGAMISAIVARLAARGVGLNGLVSCGNQAVLTMEQFVGHLADDASTELLVLFVEAVSDAAAMRDALLACSRRGKPVVALKVGASAAGTRAAASHTGALAGSYENTVAFLEKWGAVVIEDLEELTVTVEALTRRPLPAAEPRTAVITISGGLAALVADSAQRVGVAVPEPGADGLANPYDLARYTPELVRGVMQGFAGDGFNVLVAGVGVLAEHVRAGILKVIAEEAAAAFGHVYFYLAGGETAEDRRLLAESGAVASDDLAVLLRVIRNLHRRRVPAGAPVAGDATPVAAPEQVDERAVKAWLTGHGLPAPRSALYSSPGSISALRRPVVLKGVSGRVAHKTELGLVEVGLSGDEEIAAAAAGIARRLGEADPDAVGVLAEEMVDGALEAFVGCVRDPVLGPVVVVGSGGTLVELVRDVAVLVPPLTREEVQAKLEGTILWRRLSGYRGRRYDADALVEAVLLVARLGAGVPGLESLEVNPLFVTESGVLAGDAKLTLSPG